MSKKAVVWIRDDFRIKNNPGFFLDIIVFDDNSLVSTPPKVTSAVL